MKLGKKSEQDDHRTDIHNKIDRSIFNSSLKQSLQRNLKIEYISL